MQILLFYSVIHFISIGLYLDVDFKPFEKNNERRGT